MKDSDWQAITDALIRFFKGHFPSETIDGHTNLRDLGYPGTDAWRSQAIEITRLPEIQKFGLMIFPVDMDRAKSINDIVALLRPSQQQQQQQQRQQQDDWSDIASDASIAPRAPKTPAAPRALKTPAAPVTTKALDQAEFQVWYGTSRKPADPSDSGKGYTSQRDSKIHYGSCTVYIPQSHKIGSTGSPWWKRILTLTDDRLKLLRIDETAEDKFWSSLASRLDAVAIDDRDALIYIHGYRVTFEDAALRAAQIGFDLSIKGAMAFFSWPSKGTLAGYDADGATIEANEDFISEFMTKFAAQSHARAVHIIAHSMGNRGVLRAVNRIAQRATRESGIPFGQIILAAADVDVDTFRNLYAAYALISKRTTLYVSRCDLAVEASEWLHEFPRVGLLPPIFVAPGIDTVNVTNADLTALGHGYVASARDVLKDMHDLIVHGTPPAKRFGLREMKADNGGPYWLIGE